MVIARRPTQPQPYAPRVTSAWRRVADAALPVAAAALVDQQGTFQPVVWLDAAQHPDVADLPRVLRTESKNGMPIVATQWLADHPAQAIVVITYIEPVSCTWAIQFDLPQLYNVLDRIISSQVLICAFAAPLASHRSNALLVRPDELPSTRLLLPIDAPDQLRAILDQWSSRQPFQR